ncbi:RICIN domain-containing protein [Paenibacillus sp. CGMCC 1.16610]|uniref:Ricin B lectin domain-containing protein n=1 Tax=Paenibacillus anseongense TaxID=2682845 RepID=A0ABW9UBP4_9BACL|nr:MULTISPECIES: RICIN domain-containing protein [Paenibacillus]MBA2937368.1 RICIN domain-containing protein [Paenibacillus sp. CGMCC 1.16610]MVQ36426.1 hypothetical protein [Paenibacillus anseongense]
MMAGIRFRFIPIVYFVILFAVLLGISVASAGRAHAANTTYYVDPAGNDANNGTSASTPWKTLTKVNATTFGAGDQILFKAGGSWSGQLHPLGSGTSGAPIVIDKYGSASNPLIDGNGGDSTVYLYNQSYWEITNLEVKNYNGVNSKRRGIFVVNDGAGTLNHIYIKNNNVHDVWGDNTKDADGSAGIMVVSKGTTPSKFNDVLIDGNTVGPDVDRTGIVIVSTFWCRSDVNCTATPNWYPSTNVVISNNYVQGIGGDGIVPQQTDGAIVQYNTVNGFNLRSNSYNAGIWPWDADNTVIQYNESYNGHSELDGTGFDADYGCTNTIIQYNYSHDNDGGFLLIMGTGTGKNDQTTARYNISQNDKRGLLVFSQGNPTNFQAYNNDFYIGSGMWTDVVTADWGTNPWWMYNNIIYNLGSGGYNLRGINSDYNLYYGNHPSSEPNESHKLTSDPAFVNVGSGNLGRASLNGYKLLQDSPAIGSGVFVNNNGGKDFWGNNVASSGSTNRGAYNGAGIASGFTSSYYKIISRNSGKALSIPGSSNTDGVQLQQLAYTGGDNQQWQIVYVGGGNYKIVSKLNSKAIDLSGYSTTDGASIIQWPFSGGDNQLWKLSAASPEGYYKLISKLSGKAVDISGGSTADGTPIIQWPFSGSYNQQWELVPVP